MISGQCGQAYCEWLWIGVLLASLENLLRSPAIGRYYERFEPVGLLYIDSKMHVMANSGWIEFVICEKNCGS